MKSIAFKIIAFVLVINLGVGMLNYIANGGSFENKDGTFSTQGLSYNEDLGKEDADDLETEFGSPNVEDSSSVGEQLLDTFSLGVYSKAKGLINNTLYGIITLLQNINLIGAALAGMLKGFLTFLYLAAVFELFTGKTIFG